MTRQECLDAASQYIHGDRDERYGGPEDNFTVIAVMWSAYLSKRFKRQIVVEPYDVAAMMMALKIARIANAPGDDHWADAAGYAACGAEVSTKENQLCES